MTILLVTSRQAGCGVSEHSDMLMAAVTAADPSIRFVASAEALDPTAVRELGDIVHLNYHAALHSRWTSEPIQIVRAHGYPVVVTYHDTGVPNADQCHAVITACDAAVVHEPFDDLPAEKVHYWRQGVPDWDGRTALWPPQYHARPWVGTVGHDFPWKNVDLLCELAAMAGWGVLFCTPTLTAEREAVLRTRNPWFTARVGLTLDDTLATLALCDATAFLYVTANTGTSGAIRLGIAAKKPLIAFTPAAGARQFCDLWADDLARQAIRWCTSVDDVRATLQTLPLGRFDAGIAALAEQDSWVHLGRKYANLYRSLVA